MLHYKLFNHSGLQHIGYKPFYHSLQHIDISDVTEKSSIFILHDIEIQYTQQNIIYIGLGIVGHTCLNS